MKRLFVFLVLATVLLGACSGSSDDGDGGGDATTAPESTTAPEATTAPTEAPTEAATPEPTEEAAAADPSARPATPAAAALGISYNTVTGVFDAEEMRIDEGDITAEWYQADGFYVVVYAGLDLDATGPLCPGNSIQLASGAYEFVSNAPTEGADCSSFPTLTSDADVGPLVCQGVVSYRTAIPSDTEGNLFGTLERPVEGGLTGVTSITPTSAGTIPEVDLKLLSC